MDNPGIEHLRQWIGKEQVLDDVITEDLARKYHAVFDMPHAAPREGERAPRLIHFCLAQQVLSTAGLGPDGHPARGDFLPPVSLPRRMWAGGKLTFVRDLHVGDRVQRNTRIEDVALKQGRTGTLCFVTVSHRISVRDEIRIEERQDIVYREPNGSAPMRAAPARAPGQHTRSVIAGTPLLFRYSALTFNTHRIHYDLPYATQEEGYPGLVVHGPLQATMLFNFAGELLRSAPRTFSFRGLSPLLGGEPFMLNASRQDAALKLWTSKEDGSVTMEAEAS